MSGGAQESLAAEKLRERRAEEEGGEGEKPQSIREAVMGAKREKDSRGMIGEKMESALNPAKMGTSILLNWALGVLIPSFGLSLIYINMHVFLRWIFGDKLFCKLGEEWVPKQVGSVLGEEGKMTGKGIGLIEVMGLVFLDLAVLIIILVQTAIIILTFDVITNPLSYVISVYLNIAWDIITGVFNGK